MKSPGDLHIALRLLIVAQEVERRCAAGECCALVGMGCRGRIRRLVRLLNAGRITAAEAWEQGEEARRIAYSVRSLPPD
jgi:hypothetical protein